MAFLCFKVPHKTNKKQFKNNVCDRFTACKLLFLTKNVCVSCTIHVNNLLVLSKFIIDKHIDDEKNSIYYFCFDLFYCD